jgi:hypothetical protein
MTYGIINLTSIADPYAYFDMIKRNYYLSRGVRYIEVFNEEKEREKKDLELIYISKCNDEAGRPVMLEKFLWSLNELSKFPEWDDCDFIIRSNSSTFLNIEILEQILMNFPVKRCYAGHVNFNRFISGTCIIFSKDVVGYLKKIRPGKEKFSYDDLVIRKYMARRLIKMIPLDMKFYTENLPVDINELGEVLEHYPLIRIKNNGDRVKYDYDIWRKIAVLKNVAT